MNNAFQNTFRFLNRLFIVDGFWLHFGKHFGGKMLQKSMPKFDEKKDANFEEKSDSSGQAGGTREAIRIRRAPGARRVGPLPEIPVPDQT